MSLNDTYCSLINVNQFVYPFTLEPHVLTLESSRRSTLAAHAAKHEAYLKQRAEDKERRKREALRRIAPGFEPSSGPLVPTKLSEGVKLDSTATGLVTGAVASSANTSSDGAAPARKKDVMEDLVDHLAALDAVNGNTSASRENIL